MCQNLSKVLNNINELYGGDITFIPPTSKTLVNQTENELNYTLPNIFHCLYEKETNGIFIDNKIIYSIFDPNQKKTFSDNLTRVNNPIKSYWFKYKPEIFKDYLIIGSDNNICFCIYKHNNFDNPSIYICENPNSKSNVILEKLDLDLSGLIKLMVNNAFL